MATSLTTKHTDLPYEVVNIILEFLSHITDNGESGYYIKVNKHCKMRLTLRPAFTGILDIIRLKQNARYVQLSVNQSNNRKPVYITALEHPLRNEKTTDYRNGFISDKRCYTYSDPENTTKNAYIESRIHNGTIAFYKGCVYGENNEFHIILAFSSELDTARIVIKPMIRDLEEDLGVYDDFDFYALPLLQMYM